MGMEAEYGRGGKGNGVQVGNQQMCLQEGKWEKEEGQGGERGKRTGSRGEVRGSVEPVCRTSGRCAERVYWSVRRAKIHGKTNSFVRIVTKKLINHLAVCTTCLPNHVSASLVKPQKKNPVQYDDKVPF